MASEPSVDRYGQFTGADWPGKVTSDEQLRQDAAKEAAAFTLPDGPREGYDRFGGRIEGVPRKATGFFRLEKIDGRWWLISPEGNRFFLQGVDAVSCRENGYNTPLNELDGSPRKVHTELPDRKEFPDAYLTPGKVSYLIANLQRKYGPDYDRIWREVTRRRFREWGFNATAKWSWGITIGLPYIEDAHLGDVRRIDVKRYRAVDPYDPAFAERAEPSVRAVCEKRRNDPMLIAYSIENENGWSPELVELILREGADSPAKNALLEALAARRNGDWKAVGALWGRGNAGRKELLQAELTLPEIPAEEVAEFIRNSSARYHRILRELFRRHDPDHLFMGAAHCPKQSPEWYLGAAGFVDFLGFNIYGLNLGWVARDMALLQKADTPFAVLEYSFVTEERGYPPYSGNNTVVDQEARGIGFRYFTENAAANELCIGFGYFIYWDQPVTRRNLPNGEAFLFGLVNQCDQPYQEMLAHVKTANANLFDLHAGKGKPFYLERPRSILGTVRSQALLDTFLPGSISSSVIVDPSNPHYFNGETARLKVDENAAAAPGLYHAGVAASGDGQRFTGFDLTVFLWKKASPGDPAHYFVVEESGDNQHYSPVELEVRPDVPGEFNCFRLVPRNGLKRNTAYLRFGIRADSVQTSWAAQIGQVRLDK